MNDRRGFTLLEVVVAVAMVGLIAITLQRFVSTTLIGISASAEREQEVERMSALFRYIDQQLDELPVRGQSTLLGTPHKFGNSLNSDEMQWRCLAGSGTMSSAGDGEWFSILTLMPEAKSSNKLNLVLRRRYVDAADTAYEKDVPLLKDVAGLKIEYFSQQLNAWLDRWNDQNARPRLVRLLLWKTKDSLPERAVFTVNASRVER
jgi:prepilin-type N-terminal cleavage/methylation domain-containing protein